MVSSDGDQGAPATRSTRQLEPAAAVSPSRTALPKTTREFDAYPIRINSRHPRANEIHDLHSRHFALPATEERVGGIDRTLDRNLRRRFNLKLADTARPVGYNYAHDKALPRPRRLRPRHRQHSSAEHTKTRPRSRHAARRHGSVSIGHRKRV